MPISKEHMIKNLEAISLYYKHNIGSGKTTATMLGAVNSERPIGLVTEYMQEGVHIKKDFFGDRPNVTIFNMNDAQFSQRLRGWAGVLVLEPSVVEKMVDFFLNTEERAVEQNDRVKDIIQCAKNRDKLRKEHDINSELSKIKGTLGVI